MFPAIRIALLSIIVAVTGLSQAHAEQGFGEKFRNAIDRLLPDQSTKTGQIAKSETAKNAVDQVPSSELQIQLSFAPVVKKVAGSVVNVYGKQRTREVFNPFAGDPIFERFFGAPQRQRGRSSVGSGVVVSADGTIITNNHVIEKMDEINVVLADGREFQCELVLADKRSDLAVLKAKDASGLIPIEIADSDDVEVGDLVLAIGNPFGVGQTVTSGIVSAVSRSLAGINDYGFFIQTDAAINPGNSGGALVDVRGRLIGINTMIYSKSGGSVGIGYAVPSNMTQVVLSSARTGDSVSRPWIGATFQNVSSEIAESLGLDRPHGALVVGVKKSSPASDAGLQAGDVVLSVNGRAVEHPDALGYRLDTVGVGQAANLDVLSRGQQKKIEIALMSPPEDPPRDIRDLPRRSEFWGARIANLSPALIQELGINFDKEGVIVLDVAPNSPAAYNGVRPGDIVREVNGDPVDDAKSLEEAVSALSRSWQVVVERGDNTLVFERTGGFLRQYRK